MDDVADSLIVRGDAQIAEGVAKGCLSVGRIWVVWHSSKTPGEIIEHCSHALTVVSTGGDGGKIWKEVLAVDPDGSRPLKASYPSGSLAN